MAIGDMVRLNIIGAMFGQRVMWGHHFRFVTAQASMDGLASDYLNNVVGVALIQAITADVGIMGIEVSDVRADGPESIFHSVTGNLVGQIPPPSMAPQDACCISVHTGMKGRRRRGRFYVPGLSAAAAAGGTLAGQQLTNLETYAGTVTNRYTAGGSTPNTNYRWIIYSPADPGFVDSEGNHTRLETIFTDVLRTTTDPVVRTQRRRQLGVGA
jgi:hypothetical protein